MNAIFKYRMMITDTQKVLMPKGAKILTVQIQHGVPCLWALVNQPAPDVEREFRVIGTGHPIPDAEALEYIGTIQVHEGGLVFHVFESLRKGNSNGNLE
jgi:hypothetical protein